MKRLLNPVLLALSLCPLACAASLVQADPAAGGVTYYWTATLGQAESVTTPNAAGVSLGAWSWEDEELFNPGEAGRGWTHTSQWAAIELTQASTFTVTLAANSQIPSTVGFLPSDQFFPSFSLYSGWDNDTMPDAVATLLGESPGSHDSHTYNNRGDINWAEDLTYIGHKENTTLDTVTATWTLAAGRYSVILGSNAPSALSPPRQGYAASFTTSAVPEPSSLVLTTTALCGLIFRRRRSSL
jgi:hypothetical protein